MMKVSFGMPLLMLNFYRNSLIKEYKMIKSLLIKFSLLLCITGSNFVGALKGQGVKAQKPSIAKRTIKWVEANPAKTIAIAAITGVVIGGASYGGYKLYKSSEEKKLHAQGMVYVPGFEEFEKSDFYRNLSMKDKEKLIQENIDFAKYADNIANAKGLPSLYLGQTKEAYRKFVLKKLSEKSELKFQLNRIETSFTGSSKEKKQDTLIEEELGKVMPPIYNKLIDDNNFKKNYPLAVKNNEFVKFAAFVEFLSE